MPPKQERQQTPTTLVSSFRLCLSFRAKIFQFVERQSLKPIIYCGLGWQVQHPFKEQGWIQPDQAAESPISLFLCFTPLIVQNSFFTPNLNWPLSLKPLPLVPSQQAIPKYLCSPFSLPLGVPRAFSSRGWRTQILSALAQALTSAFRWLNPTPQPQTGSCTPNLASPEQRGRVGSVPASLWLTQPRSQLNSRKKLQHTLGSYVCTTLQTHIAAKPSKTHHLK